MKKIDLLLSTSKCYTRENFEASFFKQALDHLGIECSIFRFDQIDLPSYFHSVKTRNPACSLSFGNIFLNDPPIYLYTHRPHVIVSERSFVEAFPYLKHALGKVMLSDQTLVHSLDSKNVHYFPTPVDPSLYHSSMKQREYEVVIFNDLIDLPSLFLTWKVIFSSRIANLLEKALELIPTFHPLEAIERLFSPPKNQQEGTLGDWVFALEEALQTKQILPILNSIKGVNFHLFGRHIGNNWYQKLSYPDQIFLHDLLPYTLHLDVLKKSKILITSEDSWSHLATAYGCLAIRPDDPQLEHQITLFLENEKKRSEKIAKTRKKLLSWEQTIKKYFLTIF
ncbi:MAG: hypothetical protein KDK55_04660 [Chlamydiia bacterium]|nr:hypothetical protein [Chlamydiia bacterium]